MKGSRMKKQWIAWAGAVLVIGGLVYFGLLKDKFNTSSTSSFSVSAWVVDWHLPSGLHDYELIADGLASLHVFALYFDANDGLYFTPGLGNALPELLARDLTAKQRDGAGTANEDADEDIGRDIDRDGDRNTEVDREVDREVDGEAEGDADVDADGDRDAVETALYLTVVNDIWHEDGTVAQKDTSLVSRLIATPESRRKHVQQLVDIVVQHGFDGLEIDYERIADEDWGRMEAFYTDLHAELTNRGKALRVVLEPRAPIEELSLPPGPSYVMMAYNLYGTHSGPGPKADQAFLKKLAARMDHLPGEPIMALAAGGFDWSADGDATSLTELAAIQLAEQVGASRRRDQASGAVFFAYTDEADVNHTVWYADADTFKLWIETLRGAGIQHVAMWRLGEWSEESLHYLTEIGR